MSKRVSVEPKGVNALNHRIKNAAGGAAFEDRLRRTVATTVVAQMLPAGAVKGGTAMKLRFGPDRARASRDVDVSRRQDLAAFLTDLNASLAATWGGFGGRVVESRTESHPVGVPADYIMQAYDVKLTYKSVSWCTVPLEVGSDEIGDTKETEDRIAPELITLFAQLGLPAPHPVPVLAVRHQVAQKLHACSAPGNDRAHDLVDLQLLDDTETGELGATKDAASRLFRFRNGHQWPPQVVSGPNWESLYAEAADGMGVLSTVDDAVVWANDLIGRIDRA